MSVYEYAIYKTARELMTPAEVESAIALSLDADAGFISAKILLSRMILAIVTDTRRRKKHA